MQQRQQRHGTRPHATTARKSRSGMDITFKISGDQTGGVLAICEMAFEPGRLVPSHLHDTEDEYSYVIDGRIGVLVGEEEFTADAGSWVRKPRGIVHTFWKAGPKYARTIRIVLLAVDGVSNTEIAARVGATRQTVVTWRQRYVQGGGGGAGRCRPAGSAAGA